MDDNPDFRAFRDATDVRERFAVWRDTYKFDFTTQGIFEDNIQPYHIGKDKYSLADLHPIAESDQQKKYHEFATILRQHNVSGRENAFDKLVNLFLCKLVDEARNPKDLKFYWKGVAYDTHFDLFDRLQQLYQAGMKEFLGEDITYIDQGAVRNAMRFIRQNPDATQKAVWHLFLQQKFFTNNDFSFIDVHNERLFYQNADVLLKILQMWQDIRLTGDHKHNQFLGDLFEGFLDQGIKQSEGQFFTPGPICRFILMSLPLKSLLERAKGAPRAIDYACGAGHFLTELASQLRTMLPEHANLSTYHKEIYGIEKEYRLSKVAKVSAFMYGQRDIHICYGDGLVAAHDAFPGIRDNSFDLLVANPPYSVRGFLETLPEEDRKRFTLAETVKDYETANSIETFFVERAKQLLKADGVAAVILPASILSNGDGVYVRAREILIRYFDIVAITEFGSGTFGKTGTNTVTMFLRRKPTGPDTAEHYAERVEQWFGSDDNQPVYKDEHLIDAYASHIGVTTSDYTTLLQGKPNATLRNHDTFKQYRVVSDGRLARTNAFKKLPQAKQKVEAEKAFVAFSQAIERDKLYHFVMASDQPYPVLLIRSPTESRALKKFLGYEWSSAKGREGLQQTAATRARSPLYDEANRNNQAKLNRLIADNFDGHLSAIPTELSEFAGTARLVDLLDFARVEFGKQIALSARRQATVTSRWTLSRLTDLVEVIGGGTPDTGRPEFWDGPIPWLSVGDFASSLRFVNHTEKSITQAGLDNSNTKLLKRGDLILSARGTVGALAELAKPMAFNQSCYGLRIKDNKVVSGYIFYVLKREMWQLKALATGSKFDSITTKMLDEVRIPVASTSIQAQLIAECEAVDAEVEEAQKVRDKAVAEIAARVNSIYASKAPRVPVGELAVNVQYGLNEKLNEDGKGYRCFRMNEIARSRMVDNGAMKRAVISPAEFTKYRLNHGDLLLIRSNGSLDNVGQVGLFDLDGDYCYASYLVRIAPDLGKMVPRFLAAMLGSEPSRRKIESLAVKSGGTNNLSAGKMKGIKVPILPLALQRKFVVAVGGLEAAITAAESVIAEARAKKNAILARYL